MLVLVLVESWIVEWKVRKEEKSLWNSWLLDNGKFQAH